MAQRQQHPAQRDQGERREGDHGRNEPVQGERPVDGQIENRHAATGDRLRPDRVAVAEVLAGGQQGQTGDHTQDGALPLPQPAPVDGQVDEEGHSENQRHHPDASEPVAAQQPLPVLIRQGPACSAPAPASARARASGGSGYGRREFRRDGAQGGCRCVAGGAGRCRCLGRPRSRRRRGGRPRSRRRCRGGRGRPHSWRRCWGGRGRPRSRWRCRGGSGRPRSRWRCRGGSGRSRSRRSRWGGSGRLRRRWCRRRGGGRPRSRWSRWGGRGPRDAEESPGWVWEGAQAAELPGWVWEGAQAVESLGREGAPPRCWRSRRAGSGRLCWRWSRRRGGGRPLSSPRSSGASLQRRQAFRQAGHLRTLREDHLLELP